MKIISAAVRVSARRRVQVTLCGVFASSSVVCPPRRYGSSRKCLVLKGDPPRILRIPRIPRIGQLF